MNALVFTVDVLLASPTHHRKLHLRYLSKPCKIFWPHRPLQLRHWQVWVCFVSVSILILSLQRAGEGKTKGTKKDEETVEEKKEKKELYPIGLDSWNKKCEDGRFNEFLVNCDAIGLERSNQDRNREAKAESAFRGLSDLVKKMKSDMAEAEAAARGDPKQADKAKELAALREKLDVAAAALPLA